MAERRNLEWWDDAVVYKICIRRFADANGDGVGDLPGIRSRLPYLAELDIDALWITPFYPAPCADDVAGYCDVDPALGTLADFDGLLADAHELGLRVIIDIVLNHSSSEHWNNAGVRTEFESILRFWIDRGVDGFRTDVAHGLFELHPLYREWRRLAGHRLLLGEAFLSDPIRTADYVRPDELQLALDFKLLWEPWDADALRGAIDATIGAAVGATPTWVLENHDVPRLVTRYGSVRQARAAALLLLALPGAAFLYAGQELGLEEVDLPDEARQDPAHWSELSVAAQRDDPDSMLSLYREALRLRPRGRTLSWRKSAPGTLVFERGGIVCAVNVDAQGLAYHQADLLLSSDPATRSVLPPGTAAWLRA
jgi:alpha-glucosidase